MFETGAKIYFKREGDTRRLKGEIVGKEGDRYIVRGARTAGKFAAPVLTLQANEIIADHVPHRCRPKRTECHGSGLSILVDESVRRKETLAERLGMTEEQVLQARAMLTLRRQTLRKLAATNRLSFSSQDYEFEELQSEYLVSSLAALRSAVSKATNTEIDLFKGFLREGRHENSRIVLTVARTAKTAAIRYLKQRTAYLHHHVSIDDMRSLAA